jgi:hypothetical protein
VDRYKADRTATLVDYARTLEAARFDRLHVEA